MKLKFITVILLFLSSFLTGQVAPIWVFVDSTNSVSCSKLVIQRNQNVISVLGYGTDSQCNLDAVTSFSLNGSGNLISDTLYELDSCNTEWSQTIATNRNTNGFYLFALHERTFPNDSLFVYSVNASGALSSGLYCGENLRTEPMYYQGCYYFSSDDAGNGKAVYKLDASGNVSLLNTVIDPYFSQAPAFLCAANGYVFEFQTSALLADSSWLCYKYDTIGAQVDSFVYDADPNSNEALYYVEAADNVIFSMTTDLSSNKTFPTCVDLSGNMVWKDTLLFEGVVSGGACVDTVNDFAFVLCNITGIQYRIFSYDIATGTIQNSVTVDSVWYSIGKIRIFSGPTGGVFFTFRKWGSNEIVVLQYDQYLNLLWSGAVVHPSCTSPSYPIDADFDSTGALYILGESAPCGVRNFVAKFSPSLVGIEDRENQSEVLVYPNPANEYFTIELPSPGFASAEVLIMDITGKPIRSFVMNGSVLNVPTSDLPSGIYFIHISSDARETITLKQIIQK